MTTRTAILLKRGRHTSGSSESENEQLSVGIITLYVFLSTLVVIHKMGTFLIE